MRKIFISYRRVDGEYAAGALGRELRRHFGDEQVFRDKEDIGGGQAWRRQVLLEIDRDCAMLVLIGHGWAQIKDSQQRRRLDNPDDPIRLEIADGIKDGAAVIPVLLENSQMPDAEELPDDLRPMAEFNALKLRDGDWDYDLKNILKTLERVGFKPPAAPAPQPQPPPQPLIPEQSRLIDPSIKKTNMKAIIGAVVTFFALAALGSDDLDHDGHLGVMVFAIVGLVLGILAMRETKDQKVWRFTSIGVITLSALAFLGGVGGLEATPKQSAQAQQNMSSASMQQAALNYDAPQSPASTRNGAGVVTVLRGHASIHYDDSQWQVDTENKVEPGSSQYVHHSGELYMKVIPERIQIHLPQLVDIGFNNVLKVDANAQVTREGSQRINGLDMSFREIEATVNGIPLTFYAHYYSDEAGSIQLVGWTGRALMDEYRGTIEQFVRGFQVARQGQ